VVGSHSEQCSRFETSVGRLTRSHSSGVPFVRFPTHPSTEREKDRTLRTERPRIRYNSEQHRDWRKLWVT